jgi:hypothetical protein
MASTKANVGIWGTVVTTVGAIIIAVVANSGHGGGSTTSTPTPTPVAGVIQVPSGNDFLWVYGTPVGDPATDRIGQIAHGQQVQIACTVQGPAVQGTLGTTTVWDRIHFNTGYGFVNDSFVETPSDQPVAPSC